jgi:hypothetical protein
MVLMKTVQTNVRVGPEDQALIVAAAARLAKVEEQVAWLLSGAIVVPTARPPRTPPRVAAKRS